MASFKRPDLIQILDGSFDAGLMIDKKGKVRYANVPARQMLRGSSSSRNSDDDDDNDDNEEEEEDDLLLFGGLHMDALMEFLERGSDGNGSSSIQNADCPWKDVYEELCLMGTITDTTATTTTTTTTTSTAPPNQWTVKFHNQKKATIRLMKVSSPDRNDYILAFLRYQEDLHSNNYNNNNNNNITKTFDASEDPMMAIDQSGVILMMNHPAIETIDWIDESLVGQNIATTPLMMMSSMGGGGGGGSYGVLFTRSGPSGG